MGRNHAVAGGYESAGDRNGDGRPDLLYDNPTPGALVLMSTRRGLRAQSLPQLLALKMPTLVDLDGDGRPEVVGMSLARVGAHTGHHVLLSRR